MSERDREINPISAVIAAALGKLSASQLGALVGALESLPERVAHLAKMPPPEASARGDLELLKGSALTLRCSCGAEFTFALVATGSTPVRRAPRCPSCGRGITWQLRVTDGDDALEAVVRNVAQAVSGSIYSGQAQALLAVITSILQDPVFVAAIEHLRQEIATPSRGPGSVHRRRAGALPPASRTCALTQEEAGPSRAGLERVTRSRGARR